MEIGSIFTAVPVSGMYHSSGVSTGSLGSVGSTGVQGSEGVAGSSGMTDDQLSTMMDIISQYDGTNFSEDDFIAMSQQFEDAGIQPSAEMKEALDAAGIDVGQYVEVGMGAPDNSLASSDSIQSLIQNFIEAYESGQLEDADVTALINLLQDGGYDVAGVFVDTSA